MSGRSPPPPRQQRVAEQQNDVELERVPQNDHEKPPQQEYPTQQQDQQQQQDTPAHAPTARSRIQDYPRLNNGKIDYSKSLPQLADPSKVFDSDVTIHYKNVSVTVAVPQDQAKVGTFISPCVDLAQCVKTAGGSCKKTDFHCLDDISGVVRPGELTLILSPPGHGKSTFLRALANRIPLSSGHVVYNGRNFEQARDEGCDLVKMTMYTDQTDTHAAQLTVYETIDFAHSLTSVNYDPQRVEDCIRLLGLEECRDTILGNAMIRGVSGGQRYVFSFFIPSAELFSFVLHSFICSLHNLHSSSPHLSHPLHHPPSPSPLSSLFPVSV